MRQLTLNRPFSFLKNGEPDLEEDNDSESCVLSDGEGDEPAGLGFVSSGKFETGHEPTGVYLWNDGAVQSLYGSRDDFDERLDMIKLALQSSGGKSDNAKPQTIKSFLMMLGILHLVRSKRWKGKNYDYMIGVLPFAVANVTFLVDNAWRRNVYWSANVGTDCASYEMKNGPDLDPSRRTIERRLPSLLDSVITRLTCYLVPIDTTKTGGAKIVNEKRKAQKKVADKLETETKKVITNVPV